MSELKPCPFCGGEATIARSAWFDQVTCKECRVSTAPCRTVDEAIEAWNTRHERTCRMENIRAAGFNEWDFNCSECGHLLTTNTTYRPNYCSNCGARVVGA